jgi:hypothetical protein
VARKRSFGQITRLPSKRYRARYTGPDQGLHNGPRTFETRVDAEAWLADERRLISAGVWSSPAARRDALKRAEEARLARVFEDYARAWLDSRHDVRPSTRASYSASLTHHLVPWFGRTPVDEITSDDVRAWYASYGNRTLTARAHAYAVLTAVMARAVDDVHNVFVGHGMASCSLDLDNPETASRGPHLHGGWPGAVSPQPVIRKV